VGVEERLAFAGASFVVAPDGAVLGRAGGGAEILTAEVHLSRVAESHARRLFLRDRRPELYAGWLGRP
jgi:N-carbamoylputrescine amidase